MDSNIYEGYIRNNNYTIKRTNARFIDEDHNASTHWETIFKTSAKINVNDPIEEKRNLIKKGDLIDAEENAFFGIPTRILFTRDS